MAWTPSLPGYHLSIHLAWDCPKHFGVSCIIAGEIRSSDSECSRSLSLESSSFIDDWVLWTDLSDFLFGFGKNISKY